MKKTILTFVLCLSSIVVFSQTKYTYSTAKKLDAFFDDSKLKSNPTDQCVDTIVLKNFLGKDEDDVKYFSEENPFIKIENPFLEKDNQVEWYKDFKSFLDIYNICQNKEENKNK